MLKISRVTGSIIAIALVLGALVYTMGTTSGNYATSPPPAAQNSSEHARISNGLQGIDFIGLQNPKNPMGLLAHALGSVDGVDYTNSREAFEHSYAKGFRYFEVDLMQLQDGSVITAHDGHESHFGLTKTFPELTRSDMENRKYDGTYTPMYSAELIQLIKDHPDVYVVLDTKANHADIVHQLVLDANSDSSVLDRLIPHISDQANYDSIMSEYRFKFSILALYRLLNLANYNQDEIIDLIKRNGISAVMMNINESDITISRLGNNGPGMYSFEKFHERLNEERIAHYVHSTADPELIRHYRSLGVGVYSNGTFVQ